MKNTKVILAEVFDERWRQERLRQEGKFPATCATPNGLLEADKLAVLSEEFGEVARHIVEARIDASRRKPKELRKELIEVAAVCVAWVEAIDNE